MVEVATIAMLLSRPALHLCDTIIAEVSLRSLPNRNSFRKKAQSHEKSSPNPNLRKRQLHPACERVGVQWITWHSLRHTHGTLLHELGTPLKLSWGILT